MDGAPVSVTVCSAAALAARVTGLPELAAVRAAVRAAGLHEAWLVGGALRDLALGRTRRPLDLDLALPGPGAAAARRVAAAVGGSPFLLDSEQGAWRVAVPGGGSVDLVPLRAATIGDDLRARDFTANALAYDLLGGTGLLDPLGGLDDLAAGLLRACSAEALADDPVRVLRAYRFQTQLRCRLAPELPAALGAAAPGLGRCAPERIRTELFAILDLPGGSRALRPMADHQVLTALFPFVAAWSGFDQGSYHSYDLREHSLRTVEAAEDLLGDGAGWPHPERLAGHLAAAVEGGISRRALLLCAALLHDIAKPATALRDGSRMRFLTHEVRGGKAVGAVLAGLRVGRRGCRAAERVVAAHLRLFQLATQDPATERARLRYLQDLDDEVPEALLLAVADECATGPAPPTLAAVRRTAVELLALYWERKDRKERREFLRGRDLVERLGIAEGPLVGRILREVAEAERLGTVHSRKEALALARRIVRRETAAGTQNSHR